MCQYEWVFIERINFHLSKNCMISYLYDVTSPCLYSLSSFYRLSEQSLIHMSHDVKDEHMRAGWDPVSRSKHDLLYTDICRIFPIVTITKSQYFLFHSIFTRNPDAFSCCCSCCRQISTINTLKITTYDNAL